MPIHPEADYRSFLEEGRFMIQHSPSTGGYVFYPRIVEPGTGATDLEWVEASGKATVYASTIVRVREPGTSYNVVLVDLAEGPRMMSQVVDIDPEAVRIGMAVRARIVTRDDAAVLVFEPDDEAA